MNNGRRRVLLLLLVVATVGLTSARASAAEGTTGPVVSLDRYEISPGDRVVLTIGGFESNAVTITVCGNGARRGSSDCNMVASEGRRLSRDGGTTLAELPVAAPPVPCPCVIRVSTADNDQVAIAPITLVGHPVAPVVAPDTPDLQPLDISIVANELAGGLSGSVQSSLGGATTYEVTVMVRNRTTGPIEQVRLSGSAGRGENDEAVVLGLSDPGRIGPSQTWRETVQVELPAPVFGSAQWRVTVSGAGPSVTAIDETSHLPVLLLVIIVVFLLDLSYLAVRMVRRSVGRIRKGSDDQSAGSSAPLDPESVGMACREVFHCSVAVAPSGQ